MITLETQNSALNSQENIIIVGGGAGGLELAVKLGRRYKNKARKVILVDKNRTHIWKPLLHEVAAGSLDPDIDGVDYLSVGNKNGFIFHLGSVVELDRKTKKITLAPLLDDDGNVILNSRELEYVKLVFAIGSVTNDFGTGGAKEHCIFLDSPASAQKFHIKLLNEFLKLQSDDNNHSLEIAIVGAGATGVELAAELYKTSELLKSYGYNHLSSNRLKVTVVEAGPRILPALPERIAKITKRELEKLGVEILLDTAVSAAETTGLHTKDGRFISSRMSVWAAGIKGPDFLANIGGLETNRINQIVVTPQLVSVTDENIYALGDCAHCLMPDGSKVPPRAQSAHQMASHVFNNIKLLDENKPQTDYKYVDYGSLVSLSTYSTVGSLMGNLTSGSMFIEGRLARIVYISLYRMHQVVIYGKFKTLLFMFASRINNRLRPNLKLH
ncbi:NAD(P)/FAD-dependent oxidoreductase [Brumicola pallidula]|uniref:NADH dehydrogenase n=1 Tax=Brumicola pallidula DSM 14239 = ACAM 615 TaxID=1121922 RepID=K6ZF09_9ALTE|nr:NAD(P)/FAD-dependent oxidoreductase [Glaciecola pallidula]GAC28932.1 NADH dehydrogenase [Glaciecola pallidula DSM 14239 = ACAM 615]